MPGKRIISSNNQNIADKFCGNMGQTLALVFFRLKPKAGQPTGAPRRNCNLVSMKDIYPPCLVKNLNFFSLKRISLHYLHALHGEVYLFFSCSFVLFVVKVYFSS